MWPRGRLVLLEGPLDAQDLCSALKMVRQLSCAAIRGIDPIEYEYKGYEVSRRVPKAAPRNDSSDREQVRGIL